MNFLDYFDDDQRTRFLAASSTRSLERGEYLLRRGEPGGDVYLLEEGALEVVDSRATPVVILAVLEAGTVVGEMAFIDGSPRSADVRAPGNGQPPTVRRWGRDDLQSKLKQEPGLAAAFYESIARMAAARMRNLTTTAVSGAIGQGTSGSSAGLTRVKTDAQQIALNTREALREVETALRSDPDDLKALRTLTTTLDELEGEVDELFEGITEPAHAEEGAEILCRDLHPYLVRSALAERCIRRPGGTIATTGILSHVLVNSASGDGHLGELLDRWLLDRPSLAALRSIRGAINTHLGDWLGGHEPPRRLLQLNAGTGSLVADAGPLLAERPTAYTVVDPSREALAFVEASARFAPKGVEVRTEVEDLARLAMGTPLSRLPRQHLVLASGLVEYMPDRVALSLMLNIRQLLAPGGRVIITALQPSRDHALLDRLLTWPTIRRPLESISDLLIRTGFDALQESPVEGPGLLFVARRADG